MNVSLWIGLALVAGIFSLWRDGMRARETAVDVSRSACRKHGVQLLDDTVEIAAIGLVRAEHRRWLVRRVYHFEYTADGAQRFAGTICLIGYRVDSLHMPGPDGTTLH